MANGSQDRVYRCRGRVRVRWRKSFRGVVPGRVQVNSTSTNFRDASPFSPVSRLHHRQVLHIISIRGIHSPRFLRPLLSTRDS
jgi:hypothetical protein